MADIYQIAKELVIDTDYQPHRHNLLASVKKKHNIESMSNTNKIISNYADRIKELSEELNHYIKEINRLIAEQNNHKK